MSLTNTQTSIVDNLVELRSNSLALMVSIEDAADAFSTNNEIDFELMNNVLRPHGFRAAEEFYVPGAFGSRWIYVTAMPGYHRYADYNNVSA